ncbi:MAG: hypothetical protein V4687_17680 [Bacteroidota bacterium]
MKRLLIFLLSILIVGCSNAQDCPEGINLLPMYGNAKKCPAQIQSDNDFIKNVLSQNSDRKDAAKQHVDKGWKYFYEKQPDVAMKRFNQAWLLDSLNADVYWGFANLVGMQGKYEESLKLFHRSLNLNPANAKVWQNASVSFGQLYVRTKDTKLLDSSVSYLKTAAKLAPNDAGIYAQLTGAYSYYTQQDSARKYLKITDGIDKKAVPAALREGLLRSSQ